jgi:N-acetylglucosaminyldiphosphoundecaprenol N-acetyl-beta-D-mannosaminyltransferase
MNVFLLGMRIDPTNYLAATQQVKIWAQAGESRCICAANVHMVMVAYDMPDFQDIVNSADLVTPDGMPLVWIMRLRGVAQQERVYGPTLMFKIIEMAASEKIPVGLLGGTPEVLEQLNSKLKQKFPSLEIAFSFSPPFRPSTNLEDEQLVSSIRSSGARILFVGLGCPKQERWMAEHRDKIPAVMVGVGAAFDFHAGHKRQASAWMQKLGLEWLFRLFQEPRRLWRRYLINNPRFVVLVILESLGLLRHSSAD